MKTRCQRKGLLLSQKVSYTEEVKKLQSLIPTKLHSENALNSLKISIFYFNVVKQ